jgi:hypothetical protein
MAAALAGCGGNPTKKSSGASQHGSSTTHKKHSSTPGY